jgi:hypothetical protein
MIGSIRRLSWIAAAVLVAAGLTACGTKEECEPTSVCGQTVNTCCTESSCYYEYSGNRVDCAGTNCNAAANAVAADLCLAAAPDASQKLTFSAAEMTSRACQPLP